MLEGTFTARLSSLDSTCAGARRWIEPWLREGSEEDVYRACPGLWAADRQLDIDRAIDYLLHAVDVGLLRIGWELNCPGCGLTIDSVERLGDVDNHFRCEMCDENKDLALDDWIHATFTVRHDVRPIRFHDPASLPLRERIIRCEAGTGVVMASGERVADYLERKMIMVDLVAPGETRDVAFAVSGGLLLACPTSAVPIAGDGCQHSKFDLTIDAEGRMVGMPERLPPGDVELTVTNDSASPRRLWMLVSEEFYEFGPPAGYNAKQLIHHPTYAKLFPDQLACSGVLTVRDVTLLFSDLVGSTAMYRDVGDLRAYERVREHFGVIAPIIEKHKGIWIKDIGDAVMASFIDPEAAVEAALEMQQGVRLRCGLELKLGIHSGGCIGVESSGRLDWFGSTVNLAARIQSLAGPGELCLSDEVYRRTEQRLNSLTTTPFVAQLRGIDEPTRVHRVVLAPLDSR